MYETCIAIRAEHQTIFDIIIYVLKKYKGMEKLSPLFSVCCSCIKSVSLINNLRWLKAEAKISGFLKSTKWSGCEYKCFTTSVFWWLDFKGLCSSSQFQIPLCLTNIGITTRTFKFVYHIASFQMRLFVLILKNDLRCLCYMISDVYATYATWSLCYMISDVYATSPCLCKELFVYSVSYVGNGNGQFWHLSSVNDQPNGTMLYDQFYLNQRHRHRKTLHV